MRTALKVAGLALVLGGLAGCGGDSDGDGGGGDAKGAPSDASTEDFCEKFNGLYEHLFSAASSGDDSQAVQGIKDWAGEMADVGTPSEMSDEAREGFEVVVDKLQELDDDMSLEDFDKIEDDLSDSQQEASDAFGDWTEENCPEPDILSDLASQIPTELPSELPSDLESQLDDLSDQLSDVPSDLESMLEDLQESAGS